MKITEAKDVTKYYQSKDDVKGYIDKRFTDPINVVEHSKQVVLLNKIILERNINKILEFAPGPARITTQLVRENGLSIDSSDEMLKLARKRMDAIGKRWTFKKGDIFKFKSKVKFDLIFGFRFFLHFRRQKRMELYKTASGLLKKNGYLVFEVMNKPIVKPFRNMLGNKKYFVYDKLYTRREIVRELEEGGFRLVV